MSHDFVQVPPFSTWPLLQEGLSWEVGPYWPKLSKEAHEVQECDTLLANDMWKEACRFGGGVVVHENTFLVVLNKSYTGRENVSLFWIWLGLELMPRTAVAFLHPQGKPV